MTSAEIITIGTELLLGDITDINTPFLAKTLNKVGVDVFRTITVGDNASRISHQIKKSLEYADVVITTGGLGPTIDDPTRQAAADAFGVDLIWSEALWEQIQKRFARFHHTPTENNRRQAYIPANAVAIENTVGTAPCFYIYEEGRFFACLPGVPAEAQHIFQNSVIPILLDLFKINFTTITRVIRTAGIGESSIDDLIADFEELENPTVGVTAYPGQVDIRITAKAANFESATKLIEPVKNEIESILKDHIYGYDNETLHDVVANLLHRSQQALHLLHTSGFNPVIDSWKISDIFKTKKTIDQQNRGSEHTLSSLYNNANHNQAFIQLVEDPDDANGFMISVNDGNHILSKQLFFGGHESLFAQWVENQLLNFIRKILLDKVKNGKTS